MSARVFLLQVIFISKIPMTRLERSRECSNPCCNIAAAIRWPHCSYMWLLAVACKVYSLTMYWAMPMTIYRWHQREPKFHICWQFQKCHAHKYLTRILSCKQSMIFWTVSCGGRLTQSTRKHVCCEGDRDRSGRRRYEHPNTPGE